MELKKFATSIGDNPPGELPLRFIRACDSPTAFYSAAGCFDTVRSGFAPEHCARISCTEKLQSATKYLAFPGDNMARTQIRLALLLASVALTGSVHLFAQAPLTVGPLTVTIPPGWTKQEFFGTVKFYSPGSTPQQFLRLQFLPSEETPQDVRQRHSTIIGNLSGIMRPGTSPQNGVIGNFIW
jgi:hypothetical protein